MLAQCLQLAELNRQARCWKAAGRGDWTLTPVAAGTVFHQHGSHRLPREGAPAGLPVASSEEGGCPCFAAPSWRDDKVLLAGRNLQQASFLQHGSELGVFVRERPHRDSDVL